MGGWLVKALMREGAEIVALIRDQAPKSMLVREGLIGRIATVSGDLECLPTMQRAIAEYAPHTVFHLAAQPLVQVAKRDPVGTLRANVDGHVECHGSLPPRRHVERRRRLVRQGLWSQRKSTLSRNPPLQGRYPYDVSKSCTDLVAQMYAATYGVKTAIARCGNLFGGGDLNFSRTIPGLIKADAGRRALRHPQRRQIRPRLSLRERCRRVLPHPRRKACRRPVHFRRSLQLQPRRATHRPRHRPHDARHHGPNRPQAGDSEHRQL